MRTYDSLQLVVLIGAQMYDKSRGRELPGNTSPVLLAELFHHQSQRWGGIARDHLDKVQAPIETFIRTAMSSIEMEERVRVELLESMSNKLQEHKSNAASELGRLLADEARQPVTYNRKCFSTPHLSITHC